MERRVSTIQFCAIAACLAGGLAISCGKGISDGRGEVFATQVFGPEGGRMELQEATLDICLGCLDGPSTVTLRRYDRVDPKGAVGPVFEIEVPAPTTFQNSPRIGIRTKPVVLASPNSFIGFLIPGAPVLDRQWIPDSTTSQSAGCPSSAICGPVQSQSFSNPGGTLHPDILPTNVLRLAIVAMCPGGNADCSSQQACTSGACQQCPAGSLCNP
jgi:hypothetical protein